MTTNRKRRPGAGRKPKGPIRNKSAFLSTRISPELREALDDEADRTGLSLSQCAESLLWVGLSTKRSGQSNRPLRAFLYLIEQLASMAARCAAGAVLAKTDVQKEIVAKAVDRWRTDRFSYEAFKVAVTRLMAFMTPKTPIQNPWAQGRAFYEDLYSENPEMLDYMEGEYTISPEVFGDRIFGELLSHINQVQAFSEHDIEMMRLGPDLQVMVSSIRYGIMNARRDLGLAPDDGLTK